MKVDLVVEKTHNGFLIIRKDGLKFSYRVFTEIIQCFQDELQFDEKKKYRILIEEMPENET